MSYTNAQIAQQIANVLNKSKVPIFQKGTTSYTGINKEIPISVNGKVITALAWNVSTPGEVTVFWDSENKRYVAWKELQTSKKRQTLLSNRKVRSKEKVILLPYNFIVGQNGGLLEGFANDLNLELLNYDIVGVTNTGGGYIAFFYNGSSSVIAETGKDILYFNFSGFNDYYGGSVLPKSPTWFYDTLGDWTTVSTYPENYYTPPTTNYDIISGRIYAGATVNNLEALIIYSVNLIPFDGNRPSVGAGLGGGSTLLDQGVPTTYFGVNMNRYPCQDGFTTSGSGRLLETRTGDFGSIEENDFTFSSNSSAKIGHTYSWFGYRALTGIKSTNNFTLNHKRQKKDVQKVFINSLSSEGLYTPNEIEIINDLNTEYNEICTSSNTYTQNIESAPRTNPISIEGGPSYDDVYTGGGNATTWEVLKSDGTDDVNQIMTYSSSQNLVNEIPRPIYENKLIYNIDNLTITISGNFNYISSIDYGSNKATTPTTSYKTETRSVTGYAESENINTVSEIEDVIQGINCGLHLFYANKTTIYKKTEVNSSLGVGNQTGEVYPVRNIRRKSSPTSAYDYFTNYGFYFPQLGRTQTEYRKEEGGNLNGEYPNNLEIYINENTYKIQQQNANLSICFTCYVYNSSPDYSETEVGDIFELDVDNYYIENYFINVANGFSSGDKEIVSSAGEIYTDYYPYTNNYAADYQLPSNLQWYPCTGTRTPYEFVKNDNPHWLGNYNNLEVDVYLKTANNLYLHCVGNLNVFYENSTTDMYGNTYQYTDLIKYVVTITEVIGAEYFSMPNYYAEQSRDHITVIAKNNYTSWISNLCSNYYDIAHNLYIVKDENGNDTVELSISQVPSVIEAQTEHRADIYRFNTTNLTWQRLPNAISPMSELSEVSPYISYHPTPINTARKKKK